jgi:hypothetical protein
MFPMAHAETANGAPQRRFRFERRIPLALLFAFLLQTGGALFWAGSAAERIAQVERETRANAGAIERVVRLEAEVTAMHETLSRIENKIDRMAMPFASNPH